MDGITTATLIGVLGLAASGVGVWVSLRERLVRAETKIEVMERTLEVQHKDHKSDLGQLRDWLDGQFGELRKVLDRKADR